MKFLRKRFVLIKQAHAECPLSEGEFNTKEEAAANVESRPQDFEGQDVLLYDRDKDRMFIDFNPADPATSIVNWIEMANGPEEVFGDRYEAFLVLLAPWKRYVIWFYQAGHSHLTQEFNTMDEALADCEANIEHYSACAFPDAPPMLLDRVNRLIYSTGPDEKIKWTMYGDFEGFFKGAPKDIREDIGLD